MKKSTENSNKKSFLKEDIKGNFSKNHKDYLGTSIPEGYFAKSKLAILDKIKDEATIKETFKKQVVFYMKPQFKYITAASLFFLLILTIWLQSANKRYIEDTNTELLAFKDNVLINSLLVEDKEIDLFAENILINEIVIKAELSEQRIDNLIIDTMVLEDALLEDKVIESLIF